MNFYGAGAKITCPCFGCEARTPGCACEAYKEWRKRFDRDKDKKQADAIINDFRDNGFNRAVRRNGKRPRGQK